VSWVATTDVRARWPGAPVDDALLQPWVDDAETIIRAEFPWVDDQLGSDVTLQPVLNLVVTRMVIRALSIPFGLRNEAVGDTSVMYYTEAAGLYMTDADRQLIAGTGPQVAFTIDGLPADYQVDPSLAGAVVNGPYGSAPYELDPFDYPPPANPDPAGRSYSPQFNPPVVTPYRDQP
jgi:hypothetical protein